MVEHTLAQAEEAIRAAAGMETGEITRVVTRSVRRLLAQMDRAAIPEVTLKSGRRADLMAVDDKASITIVEIKASIADFRGDRKWPEYREYCDLLYFAVPTAFPLDILPADTGLIVADEYEATLLREAPEQRLPAARRKAVLTRFGRMSAQRLLRLEDPGFDL